MQHQLLKTGTSICAAALLFGCVSNKSKFGSSVRAEGKAVAAIGKKWDKVQFMIKKGLRII